MTTKRINNAIEERVDKLLGRDETALACEHRFYAATAKLEQLDEALFRELDAAWVDAVAAIISAAWLDGFACGRDPMLLVLAGGEGER